MKETVKGMIWIVEKVNIGDECCPIRIKVAQKILRGVPGGKVKKYLTENRYVMCRSHQKCLEYAEKRNWDGFVCVDCAKFNDPRSRLEPEDILDRKENFLLKLYGY